MFKKNMILKKFKLLVIFNFFFKIIFLDVINYHLIDTLFF
ncbi:hypothetical protein CRENPOLYSF1_140051 [Crenothrix polyspora]|uniref:Uncharacterized protein n=1 Tax=Crenothrix polyspora TaxID=360316 RepID=A0A1R4H391_9GAMM|nr:hypothetical protein CRENPOLYSF1_140051 [Crenothrix polyspora]